MSRSKGGHRFQAASASETRTSAGRRLAEAGKGEGREDAAVLMVFGVVAEGEGRGGRGAVGVGVLWEIPVCGDFCVCGCAVGNAVFVIVVWRSRRRGDLRGFGVAGKVAVAVAVGLGWTLP